MSATDLSSETIASTFGQLLHTGDSGGLEGVGNEHYIYDANGTASIMSLGTAMVGIGTDAPGEILHIREDTAGTMGLIIHNDTNNAASDVFITLQGNQGSGTITNGQFGYDRGDDCIYIGHDTNKEIAIKDGNVGIGTASPLGILHVKPTGAISAGVETFTGDAIVIDSGSASAGEGNLGAAISWTKLDAQNGERAGAIAAIQTGADVDQCGLAFYSHSGSVDDQDAGGVISQAMTINHDQYVGIGTAAPADLLHIKKTGMTDETSVVLSVDGTGNSARRYAGFGVRYNSGATTDAPCAYIRMDTPDDSASYFWVDNGDRLMGSTTVTHIGTTSGVVQGAAATSSDERSKIISSNGFSYGLDKVNALTPMEFYYKDDVDKINRLGFGAQTTKPIIPEVVNDSKQCIDGYKWLYNEDGSEKEQVPNSDDTDGKLYMDYLQIIPVLVKAIQELSAKVEALENA